MASKRLLGLDGLRAVSILVVMAAHVCRTRVLGGFVAPQADSHAWGKIGVRVFFVISGFLITKLMLEEHDRHGDVSIRCFYVRRAYRILPAFLAYLGVVVALSVASLSPVPWNDVLHAATYTTNFDVDRHWNVGHIWSLSVEEQFYLAWPPVVAWLGRKAAFFAALATCVVGPLARWFVYRHLPVELESLGWQVTPAVADSLATGCLLAFFRHEASLASLGALGRRVVRVLDAARATPLVYALLPISFATFLLEDRPTLQSLVGVSFTNVAFALVIDRAVHEQRDPVGRLLLHPWMERIGVLSYSLYLWQQLFLRQSLTEGELGAVVLTTFPLSFALAFAAAHVSYEWLERPWLRRRPRWADR
jgi:peptidoglycan/LPS O-acetylase OafA/YrhL